MSLMLTPGGRAYDTRTGRFLSRDPILTPGESPYPALRNNPLGNVDPWGLKGEGAEQSLPKWPARLPLDAGRRAPTDFTPGFRMVFGDKVFEPKSAEELRAMWPRILLEIQELARSKAQEALESRTGVTYVKCSDAEQRNLAERLRRLREKLRSADPRKCHSPCCHMDFRTLRDVLGKLQIECAVELRHEVRKEGKAYGKQKGPAA